MKKYILSLDQGTTSSRCVIFDTHGRLIAKSQREFTQIFPRAGWVEHDPEEILNTQLYVMKEAIHTSGISPEEISGIGITNQRETTVVWDRRTGKPVYNAIVWQCRRTADLCEELECRGLEQFIKTRTGLILDPYFSASKIKWILDNVEGARRDAEAGRLCFGTVDSWLIWNLTEGHVHATDFSNASRTMLFNIKTLEWDDELLKIFGIPRSMLPNVLPSSHIFGYTDSVLTGYSLPIGGVAGDQQSALFGQCCFNEGELKNTYGTGGFLLMNTGNTPYMTTNGLITTVAWGVGETVNYALEGSVFSCGSAIQWLRDGLKILDSAAESEFYASLVPDSGDVYLVPAFSGMGAPWWDPYARGTIIGLTRATTKSHIIRATLESLAYQTADVIDLLERSTGMKVRRLRADGGASANNLLLGFQADILGADVERPECIETTALGAAYLAGLSTGVYSSIDEINRNTVERRVFKPEHDDIWRKEKLRIWRKAVERSLNWIE